MYYEKLHNEQSPQREPAREEQPSGLRQQYSPSNKEMKHMKPSNAFQDITEDAFQKREDAKNFYRLELQ